MLINALLGQNQVTLSQTRSIAEYQKTIAGNIEELENISRLTENILFLARADKNNVLVKLDCFLSIRKSKICWIILNIFQTRKRFALRSSAISKSLRIKFYCNECYPILLLMPLDIHREKSRIHITSFLDTNGYLNIDIASPEPNNMSLKNSSVDFGGR